MWFNFQTNTPGVIFIKVHEAVKDLICVHKIIEYLMENPEKLSARFALRFIPISLACKASGNIDEFERLTKPIIDDFVLQRKKEVH
jgi:hypothetical protein